jgi:tellurite resistance protein TehA-like permease
MFAVYIPLALMFAWVFARWVMLSLDATNGIQDARTINRLYVVLWMAFNLATFVTAVIGVRAAWHLPQPLPPIATMFAAALWGGVLLISSLILLNELNKRGAFGDPDSSQSSSPSHE